MRTLFISIFVGLLCSTVQAMPESGQGSAFARINRVTLSLDDQRLDQIPAKYLAETAKESTPRGAAPQPESGSLVIPGEEENQKEKKCLNVCKKWGENCVINPRTGGRDCRRTCKEFGEECF
jgi:hypothetical protein